MAGESILIVDGNLMMAKLMQLMLELEGYKVQLALDAQQAIEKMKGFRPRLVLMDHEVPHIGGIDLVKKLKADKDNAASLFLMITGCVVSEKEKDAVEAGCVGYLSKPVDTRTLPGIIAEYLRTERN